MATKRRPPVTAVGTDESIVEPMPSCPYAFQPQQ